MAKMGVSLSQIIRSLTPFRNPNRYPDYRIFNFKTTIWVGTKTVLYQGEVLAEGGAPVHYNVSLEFHGIEFSDVQQPGMIATVPIAGRVLYYEAPIIGSNDVRMRCTCSDFQYTFQWELKGANALLGNPKPYTRVPGSTRPPRNPQHVLGFCKHLWNFMKYLRNSNLIKGQLL